MKHRFWKITAGLSLAALGMVAQKKELTPRELYFVPQVVKAGTVGPKGSPKKQPVPKEVRTNDQVKLIAAGYEGPRPLGLKYNVLRKTGDSYRPVGVDKVFRSGDKIQVRVESNEEAFLYVVNRGSSGARAVLYPSEELRGGKNRVPAGKKYNLPNDNKGWEFYAAKGEERLFVILSRNMVGSDELNRIIDGLEKSGAPASNGSPMLALNRAPGPKTISRDLRLEQIEDTGQGPDADERDEAAAYIVDVSGKLNAWLSVDIRLKHE